MVNFSVLNLPDNGSRLYSIVCLNCLIKFLKKHHINQIHVVENQIGFVKQKCGLLSDESLDEVHISART